MHSVWNPTKNAFRDVLETIFVNKTNSVDYTTRMLIDTTRAQLRRSPRVTLIAHSQGSAIASSALSHLTSKERQRIDLVSLGGAAYDFPDDVGTLRVVANLADFVPWIAGYLGRSAVNGRQPDELQTVYFGRVPMIDFKTTHPVENYLKYVAEELKSERLRRLETQQELQRQRAVMRALPALGSNP